MKWTFKLEVEGPDDIDSSIVEAVKEHEWICNGDECKSKLVLWTYSQGKENEEEREVKLAKYEVLVTRKASENILEARATVKEVKYDDPEEDLEATILDSEEEDYVIDIIMRYVLA